MHADDPRVAFWSDPGRVKRFSEREHDLRLAALISRYPNPADTRVLDLGCAGGRNVEFLVEQRYDVIAVDIAEKMVEATRDRIRARCGDVDAIDRVRVGRMDDMSWADDGAFDLVVALGIYQQAMTENEWERALAESARVLKPGGRLLASVFAPGTALGGGTLTHVAGTRFVYRHPSGETMCLVEADAFDAALARLGLHPETPTETVRKSDGDDRRVTVNGLYVKGDFA